ncbi:MAG: hypothetical protein CDV28_10684 [Candidatus Electronema aureum]|uniref:Uncharacterized protein n=1 Tax=Candidatus Electronema aureum TaxID=2005002 RepID=A0A521G3C2_9BACT|nr:MAG: hypothetical protein CDV28_10684 [Candidatus Electronema aureum]
MIFSRIIRADRSRAQFERSLFMCIVFFLSLFIAVGSASAGYGPEMRRIQEGGGTWGAILEMSAKARGPSVRFTIRKKDGLFFNTESNISIRTGSYNGTSVASDIVPLGNSSVNLTVRLDSRSPAQSYYAYLFNSYGHAWVGPLKIDGYEENSELSSFDDENTSIRGGEDLGQPRIANRPQPVRLNNQVRIHVTAGSSRYDGGLVQVQCIAEDSDRPRSNPYTSGWIREGATVTVPFRFYAPGDKTISCITRNSCCSSAWVNRSIRVEQNNREPNSPRISFGPGAVKVNVPAYVHVLPGSDPDGDQIKVECKAEDSDRTSFRPVSSGWLSQPREVDTVFTFAAIGSKTISCVTVDRKGAISVPAERAIEVDEQSSRIEGKRSRTETNINISVVTDADGKSDSKVSVQSSRSEDCAPFCSENGEITYDKPYLPEYRPAYPSDPSDGDYVLPESVPDL